MHRSVLFGIALAGISPVVPTVATAETYNIDPSHARIAFTVDHQGFSDVQGAFDVIDGTLELDVADPASASVFITIDTSGVDTGWDARDEDIRSERFLNVATFPAITFQSTTVEMTGDDAATVTGDLTLLGNTLPITLDVTLNLAGPSPRTEIPRIGFRATGEIDRRDYGNETFAPGIGAVIPVDISMEFVRGE